MTRDISKRNSFALTAICLSALMLGLEITSVPSILPTLESVLSAKFQQLQWIMNAYTIAMCTVLMAMGTLGDRFGRKRVFGIGIIVFGVASLICGLAYSAPVLIAARFLQGTSAAAMLACQVAILSHQFRDGAERGKAFGVWGIVFGIGLGFGPIVGGAILAFADWTWVFLIHVAIACITLFCASIGVEESQDPTSSTIDLPGILTLSASIFSAVYLITQNRVPSSGDQMAILIAFASVASLLLFVVIEQRSKRPMFDFSSFRVPRFSGALLGSSGMNFSFWPFIIYLPIYLHGVLGYDAVAAGLTVLAYTLPTIVMPPLAEKLLLRRGPGFVIPLGLFTIGTGFLFLTFMVRMGDATWMTLLPGCVLSGIGLGLTNTPVTNTATMALPPERAGMASGMDMSARMISLSVNIAIMGVILLGGVVSALSTSVPHLVSGAAFNDLANAIAAGNIAFAQTHGVDPLMAREALAVGVARITLYATISAWSLSYISFLLFKREKTVFPTDEASIPST